MDSIDYCEKCGSSTHTTHFHILFRMSKHNLDITPGVMCTLCFGIDHLKKHCNIYHLTMTDTENKDYYKYLDHLYEYEKKQALIIKLYNSNELYDCLNEYRGYLIENKILFLQKYDYLANEIKKLFWNILYQEHSKEEIDIISSLLY